MRQIILCDLSINIPDFAKKTLDEKLEMLKRALELHQQQILKRIPEQQALKGILISHEDYFCNPDDDGRHYSAAQMRHIEATICILSKKYPGILIIPGSINWIKPAINPRYYDSALNYSDYCNSKKQRGISSIKSEGMWKKRFFYIDSERPMAPRNYTYQKLLYTAEQNENNYEVGGNQELIDQIVENELDNLLLARNTTVFYLNGKQKYKYHKNSAAESDLIFEDEEEEEGIEQGVEQEVEGVKARTTVYVPGVSSPIINIAGIQLGIEICMDHNLGLLKKHLHVHQKEKPLVDLQLILSNRVDNDPDHVVVREAGYLIHSSPVHLYMPFEKNGKKRALTEQRYQQITEQRDEDLPVTHNCLCCGEQRKDLIQIESDRYYMEQEACATCSTSLVLNFMTLELEPRYLGFVEAIEDYLSQELSLNEPFKISEDNYQNSYYLTDQPSTFFKKKYAIPHHRQVYVKENSPLLDDIQSPEESGAAHSAKRACLG